MDKPYRASPGSTLQNATMDWLQHLTPAQACQYFYTFATLLVLGITIMPETAKGILLAYGPRLPQNQQEQKYGVTIDGAQRTNPTQQRQIDEPWFVKFLSWITSYGKVPHSWFSHFYVVSVICSTFWGVQWITDGNILRLMASYGYAPATPSMTMTQVILTWFLMSLQGGRRLYESWFVMRSSSSRMWFVHWALGLAFYSFTSIAVWAEGCGGILPSSRGFDNIEMPPLKTVLGTSVFFVAWFWQNRCHVYLSKLKKYSLPDQGLFRFIVSPHYTCECALYLALSIVAAPEGRSVNRTLLCAVMFVAVNLGATAAGTKQWYIEKFGADKVRGKWRMIPWLY